jgi:hypothetical protein
MNPKNENIGNETEQIEFKKSTGELKEGSCIHQRNRR